MAPVLVEHRLALIGLYRTVEQTRVLEDVTSAIELMAQVRREHAIALG